MRKPTLSEERLLECLVKTASKTVSPHWKEELLVSPMHDGEMGSLYLFPKSERHAERVFGEQISECEFIDQDGTTVIASLNVDPSGELFELDIWKTDFSPLISFPEC